MAERDSGRITVERTDQVVLRQLRRLAVGAGPRRRPQRGLAHQRGQIGDDETRCAVGDLAWWMTVGLIDVIDYAGVSERRKKVVSTLTGGVAGLLKKNKVDVIEGEATLTGKGTLTVGGQEISSRR